MPILNEVAEALGNAAQDTADAEAADNPDLPPSQQRAVRSLLNQIQEHQAKLEAYQANPDAYDNLGYLKNAPTDEIRQQIIQGRIQHLQTEINAFQGQIDRILGR